MDFKIVKKGYDKAQVENYIQEVKKVYEEALKGQKDRLYELKNSLADAEVEIKNYQEKSSLVSKAILSAVSKAEEIEKLSQIKYTQEIEQLNAFHDRWTQYYNKILDKYPLDDQLVAAGNFNIKMEKVLASANSGEISSKIFEENLAEETFKNESERLNDTQIGYIKIKTNNSVATAEEINSIVPGADPNSPILSGNFDPLERINRYFATIKSQDNLENKDGNQKVVANKKTSATKKSSVSKTSKEQKQETAVVKNDYSDRAPSGFSMEECLNPKEDLGEIMKDLGLL